MDFSQFKSTTFNPVVHMKLSYKHTSCLEKEQHMADYYCKKNGLRSGEKRIGKGSRNHHPPHFPMTRIE